MKAIFKKLVISVINHLGFSSKIAGTPKGCITAKKWAFNNSNSKVSYSVITAEINIVEKEPIVLDAEVPQIYKNEYKRVQAENFVVTIPNGRVWGRNGAVITSDDLLLEDVSREFGKYKGVYGKKHTIFNRFKLGKVKKITGKVAVISTNGSFNYYHWMIDILPRFELLKMLGRFDEVDFFILDYTAIPFQKESLEKLNISLDKIITCNDQWNFHIEADLLIVPSLASELSIVNRWQVDFLRKTFLGNSSTSLTEKKTKKIFLSRKKAPNRKLINEKEVYQFLQPLGFENLFAEDLSLEQQAKMFNEAAFVISVHGAGLTNLVFCNAATKVIEFFPSKQVYPIFWTISNAINATYGFIISEGDRLKSGVDPVMNKSNENINIKVEDIRKMMNLMSFNS